MKYYSETDVKEMIDYAIAYGTDITSYCPSLDDYPCIEIKEPHGRCIDVDEFLNELRTTINKVLLGSLLHNFFVNDESVKQDTLDGINFVLNRLENEAPTVLEANNE